MTKERLLGFTDGVIAVIITIMVLELKAPEGIDRAALAPQMPIFLSYVLSFVFVGIYWANHHHMFQAVERIHGGILWANLHLLFWMSLTPFVTAWMGESHFAPWPVAAYGVVLLMCAIGYTILAQALVRHHGDDSAFARALGERHEGQGVARPVRRRRGARVPAAHALDRHLLAGRAHVAGARSPIRAGRERAPTLRPAIRPPSILDLR